MKITNVLSDKVLRKNPLVDVDLLRESRSISKRLAAVGARTKRRYELPSPFDAKLRKVSIFELTKSSDIGTPEV
jgi:hypothetical protein